MCVKFNSEWLSIEFLFQRCAYFSKNIEKFIFQKLLARRMTKHHSEIVMDSLIVLDGNPTAYLLTCSMQMAKKLIPLCIDIGMRTIRTIEKFFLCIRMVNYRGANYSHIPTLRGSLQTFFSLLQKFYKNIFYSKFNKD